MLICIFTGFSSGLPRVVLINLLRRGCARRAIDLKAIVLFALIQIPTRGSSLVPLLFDRYAVAGCSPAAGLDARHPGFALLRHPGVRPAALRSQDLWRSPISRRLVAFLSAKQDIVLDAYRREILPMPSLDWQRDSRQRLPRLQPDPGSPVADPGRHLPWRSVYWITGMFILARHRAHLRGEPQLAHRPRRNRWAEALSSRSANSSAAAARRQALLCCCHLPLPKLGDSMRPPWPRPFYLDIGFTKSEIGLVAKNAGLWASVLAACWVGCGCCGSGSNRGLWLFGSRKVVSIFGSRGSPTCTARTRAAGGAVIAFEALGVGWGRPLSRRSSAAPPTRATRRRSSRSSRVSPRCRARWSTPRPAGSSSRPAGSISSAVCAAGAAGMVLLVRVAPWKHADGALTDAPAACGSTTPVVA